MQTAPSLSESELCFRPSVVSKSDLSSLSSSEPLVLADLSGPVDNVPDYGSEDSRFDSWLARRLLVMGLWTRGWGQPS